MWSNLEKFDAIGVRCAFMNVCVPATDDVLNPFCTRYVAVPDVLGVSVVFVMFHMRLVMLSVSLCVLSMLIRFPFVDEIFLPANMHVCIL